MLFGTCSQLEKEDSPTALRDTQMAVHASERYASADDNSSHRRTTSLNSSRFSTVSRFTGTRDLWRVAARDLDGSTAQIEVLDLIESERLSDGSDNAAEAQDGCSDARTNDRVEEFLPPANHAAENVDKSPVPQRELLSGPESEPEPKAFASSQKSQKSEANDNIPPMPLYTGFTDAELSKEIKDYGFKPVRGRQKKIDLLRKCWESRCTNQSSNPASTELKSKSKPEPTRKGKKERKRPAGAASTIALAASEPKDPPSSHAGIKARAATDNDSVLKEGVRAPTAGPALSPAKTGRRPSQPIPPLSYEDVEEIEDSEEDEDSFLSPFRLRADYNGSRERSGSLPLSPIPPNSSSHGHTRSKYFARTGSPSCNPGNGALSSSARASLPDLDAQITGAVRAQPRLALASKRPTWHEKMLMYVPIVLEDFAGWLNTEGLGLVAEDREVSALFVRSWCEKRGVCCCWRKGPPAYGE